MFIQNDLREGKLPAHRVASDVAATCEQNCGARQVSGPIHNLSLLRPVTDLT